MFSFNQAEGESFDFSSWTHLQLVHSQSQPIAQILDLRFQNLLPPIRLVGNPLQLLGRVSAELRQLNLDAVHRLRHLLNTRPEGVLVALYSTSKNKGNEKKKLKNSYQLATALRKCCQYIHPNKFPDSVRSLLHVDLELRPLAVDGGSQSLLLLRPVFDLRFQLSLGIVQSLDYCTSELSVSGDTSRGGN